MRNKKKIQRNTSEIKEEFHGVNKSRFNREKEKRTMKKSKNSGTVLKFSHPGILIFCFCLLPFAFPNMALAQGAGNARDFDGIDDYVNCGNDESLDITAAITVEAWVKRASIDSWHRIVYRLQDNDNGYQLAWSGDNDLELSILLEGIEYNKQTTIKYEDTDTWFHVAGVIDASHTITLYVNGESVEVNDGGATFINDHFGTWIGSKSGAEAFFDGTIDEVRIWNVARTEAQIQANMCKKLVGDEEGLVGYWRFDESSGTSCTDSSPNSNIGTMVDMDPATDRVWSGAALGDASAYDYSGDDFGDFSASLTHTDGDDITATGDGGTFAGIQVYRVDATSMRTDADKPGVDWTMDPLRYWGVFAVGTIPTYTVVYDYDGHPGITDESDLALAYRDNHSVDAWANLNATLDTDANTLTKTGQSGTEYALGSPSGYNTLPVELSIFTAQFLNNVPTLYWKTESETDNLGWFIYRNTEEDFSTAEKISEFIEGHGTTTHQQSYIFEDSIENSQVGDTYYYWLESIDFSGMVSHYDKVAQLTIRDIQNLKPPVEVPKKYGLQYGPNPFSSNLNISYILRKSDMVSVKIYNIYGQLLTKFDEGQSTADKKYKLKWNGKDLSGHDVSSGVLLIELITTEGSETKRAILLR